VPVRRAAAENNAPTNSNRNDLFISKKAGRDDMSGAEFTIRRKVLTLFGAQFHIYKPDASLMGYCKQKAFKLKEDIRIYSDESQQNEKLAIAARSVIDFSAAYDVVESASATKLGALQRKGMKSLFRDTWTVLDEDDREIGKIVEESTLLSLIRRVVDWGSLIPQKFHLSTASGDQLATFRTHFNPFVHRMTVTISPDCDVHPWLVVASGILLMAIEGRQT
jgi:hypothetical protein